MREMEGSIGVRPVLEEEKLLTLLRLLTMSAPLTLVAVESVLMALWRWKRRSEPLLTELRRSTRANSCANA